MGNKTHILSYEKAENIPRLELKGLPCRLKLCLMIETAWRQVEDRLHDFLTTSAEVNRADIRL